MRFDVADGAPDQTAGFSRIVYSVIGEQTAREEEKDRPTEDRDALGCRVSLLGADFCVYSIRDAADGMLLGLT